MATEVDMHAPWDGVDAFEDTWREMFRAWHRSGIMGGLDNELDVAAGSGRQTVVGTGRCRIEGHVGKVTSSKNMAHSTNTSGNPRIDRVVARADFTGNQIELDVLTGTPGSSPSAPSLTQNSSVWEIALARVGPLASGYSNIVSGDIHDERCLLSPYGVPFFFDADARDLWLPGPDRGNMYADAMGGLFVYDTAWQQLRRKKLSHQFTPSGNEDSTNASLATFPSGLTQSVAIPEWATSAWLFAKIGQAQGVTATLNHKVVVSLGALIGDSQRVRWGTGVDGDNERDLVLAGDLAVAGIAGTTQTLRTQSQRVSGTGALRVDDESACFVSIEFS